VIGNKNLLILYLLTIITRCFIVLSKKQHVVIVAVHGLKLESRNLGEMKRVYELDVYKLAEYKAITEKLGPKLNAFINSTKA